MIITNKLNLDDALVKAISPARHNKEGCYSATTLLHGAKETILSERHFDEMETDVADNIWQIFGTATHSIFENVENSDVEKEYSLETKVLNSTVTGKCDAWYKNDKMIVDYKTASTWKVIYKDFDDWKKQGLIYAWLFSKNGVEIKHVKFEALLKDHSKSKAKIDANYPQFPVYVFEFDVTTEDLNTIENFVLNKVKEIENAQKLADDDIPECSKAERWATEGKIAVMKEGRKTAVKLFAENEKELAEQFKETQGKGAYLEERKGENKKCNEYCPCREFCNFWKNNQ